MTPANVVTVVVVETELFISDTEFVDARVDTVVVIIE
jgi:hypothetical protein